MTPIRCLEMPLAGLVCALAAFSTAFGASEAAGSVPVALGTAAVELNGPWKFHTGDDPRWADPLFDDSTWESVDLSAAPTAHDPDVGLTGYVPGWQGKGHRGYSGYGWYRIREAVHAPPGAALALCGPFYVDSAYQLFVNGRLQGAAGDLTTRVPTAGNNHLPRTFSLASSGEGSDTISIAVRVWMAPFMLPDPEAGGLHIAPLLGTEAGVAACYHREWREMFRGYAVDAIEAGLFIVLVLLVCSLIPLDRRSSAYLWMAAALVLLAVARGNQAVFFWWYFESLREFELVTGVLAVPLCLGAWTLAWARWFRLDDRALALRIVAPLTAFLMLSQFMRRSWFYGHLPPWLSHAAQLGVQWGRGAFALLSLLMILRLAVRPGRERWFGLAPLVFMSVGLFTAELAILHVRRIWFPFGIGVSLSEYAYAGFILTFPGLLLHRLYSLHRDGSARS